MANIRCSRRLGVGAQFNIRQHPSRKLKLRWVGLCIIEKEVLQNLDGSRHLSKVNGCRLKPYIKNGIREVPGILSICYTPTDPRYFMATTSSTCQNILDSKRWQKLIKKYQKKKNEQNQKRKINTQDSVKGSGWQGKT